MFMLCGMGPVIIVVGGQFSVCGKLKLLVDIVTYLIVQSLGLDLEGHL